MDITLDELRIVADEQGFDIVIVEKDYLITRLLYLLKDVKNIYFKGGTALNKIFLEHERLSEDLDFTLTAKLSEVEKDIKTALKGSLFNKITYGKKVDRFTRVVVHYKLFHEEGTIFLDLNERAKILLTPRKIDVPHFYPEHISNFKMNCLNKNEIIAEKVMAVCRRYKPRDYFDVYNLIKKGIPISVSLVKKKFKEDGMRFTPKLMFKNTNKVFNKWDHDLSGLTKTKPSFKEVMDTLKKYFKYKE